MRLNLTLFLWLACVGVAPAKIDLVTLPTRETVQVTIYNSADLTLARESRALTLRQGLNTLQFSWANTLIDPTSLELLPLAHADQIEVSDLSFPPQVRNLGVWKLRSELGGRVPVDEEVELNLGPVQTVVIEPKLMDFSSDRYLFDRNGNISGWEEIRTFHLEVKNTREVAVKVEIQRNFPSPHWEVENQGEYGQYEKVDLDTVKYTLELPSRSEQVFSYILTTKHGTRAE